MLEQLLESTSSYPSWAPVHRAVAEGKSIHLAVMVEPFLTQLLEGQKTIESRFSKRAVAPFGQINPGDWVLVKRTGGPIIGCFAAERIESVDLEQVQLDGLQRRYSQAMCANNDFWQAQAGKRYATFIEVTQVKRLPPVHITKTDRRGWLVLGPAIS